MFLPVNTRPVIRSMSPPSRRKESHDTTGTSETRTPEPGPPVQDASNDKGSSVSIRAAIRDYEMVFDELRTLNDRSKHLRSRLSSLREDVQKFMQDRNLERLGTRDGRIAVRVTTKTTSIRPGKKETMRCVEETVGEEHPDLAQKLVQRLFEENRRVRTVTRFDKRDPGEIA